ncbi:MAG TPA: hypothetical protein VKK61_00520, partial [Tepidisphaeraceae bacterium]|nr:hypothetical protein [Tepidisphaeraceae bacterium]
GTVGSYTNLSFDSTGAATVFYFDRTHNRILKSVLSKGKWTTTSIAAGGREIRLAKFGNKTALTDLDVNVPSLAVLAV